MPILPLPEDPSLENLKKQAKRLGKAVRDGESRALAMAKEFHPRVDEALADFSLTDAQWVTARQYGFASWPKLKAHLEVVERFLWAPPPAEGATSNPADTLVRLACLVYGDWRPSHADQARCRLAEHPELAAASLYVAASVGDVASARTWLARDKALVSVKGGPLRWEPLLYATYSRIDPVGPGYSTVEVARLLLENGADPNAGFLWQGNVPPFTALTGAFGEGEDGNNEPPHPECDAMARLLLEAGADPNDEQTLYNRHFKSDDGHLRLLFEYGLGQEKSGPWFERLGDRQHSRGRMLVEELWAAARKNFPERVKLLVEHGTEVDTPGLRDGRTPYEAAVRAGNLEIAAYLVAHGARKVELTSEERFAAACIAGRREEARAVLQRSPDLLARLGPMGRAELLHRAVEGDRPDGVRLMAELGFELSGVTGVEMSLHATPMHGAAWAGNLEMVKLLVELGANPNTREARFQATPLGWAAHNHQAHVVEYLTPLTGSSEGGGVETAKS